MSGRVCGGSGDGVIDLEGFMCEKGVWCSDGGRRGLGRHDLGGCVMPWIRRLD